MQISTPFFHQNPPQIHEKPSKNEVRKQTWKTIPFFTQFLHILVPSGDPWGPPWAAFVLQNATTVPEPSASGRVLVIFAWLLLPLEPLEPLWVPFCLHFGVIFKEFWYNSAVFSTQLL